LAAIFCLELLKSGRELRYLLRIDKVAVSV